MTKNHDPAGAQGSATGAAKTGEPLFFPSEGTFSTVVPLSEIEESASSSKKTLAAEDEPADDAAREIVRDANTGHEPEEQEVTTLIRPRVSPAVLSRPSPAVRLGVGRQSWPVTALAVVLSVIAGLIAGIYLVGLKQSAETPAPRAVDAASETRTETQAVTQALEPPPAPVVAADATDSGTARPSVDESAPRPAPAVNVSEGPRAPVAEPSPQRRERDPEARAANRPASVAIAGKTDDGRRAAQAARPARRTEGRVTSASTSPREISSPVFSSPPPADPGKKKVIPWP